MFIKIKPICLVLFTTLFLGLITQANAQNSAFDHKKAMLISKFIKYVGWPAEARQSKFVVAVYNNPEFYNFLSTFYTNKTVRGKGITVRLVTTSKEAKQANILYLPETQRRALTKLSNQLAGSHVLIISENSKDLPRTMVNILMDKAKSKIILKINNTTIEQEKLTIPELSFFLDNINDSEILTEQNTAVAKNKAVTISPAEKKILEFEQKLLQKEERLMVLNKQLSESKKRSNTYQANLEKTQAEVKALQKTLTEQKQQLTKNAKTIKELTEKLAVKEKQLQMNKEQWQLANEEKIAEQEKQIETLNTQIATDKKQLNNLKNKLAVAEKTNKALAGYPSLFYTFLVIAIITLAASIFLFLRWKKAQQQLEELSNDLSLREQQLMKSENVASLGYVATDITYAAGMAIDEMFEHFVKAKDEKQIEVLKPLVALLDNFNQIAADQDEEELTHFDLVEYSNKMLKLYDVEFEQSNIAYKYKGESSLKVKSIPSQVALILLNLVDNAIKHGFDGKDSGEISLTIEKSKRKTAKITFHDNGKGMPQNVTEQALSSFFTTKPERGYVGLGLSIVKNIVENKFSGTVTLESDVNKGTTVTIVL